MSDDWAWPALIQSLQNDISQLRMTLDDVRRETGNVRELHRKEIDGLIEQLRDVRDQLRPIAEDREHHKRLARETRWSWIERAGWVVIGGIALAIWHYLNEHFKP